MQGDSCLDHAEIRAQMASAFGKAVHKSFAYLHSKCGKLFCVKLFDICWGINRIDQHKLLLFCLTFAAAGTVVPIQFSCLHGSFVDTDFVAHLVKCVIIFLSFCQYAFPCFLQKCETCSYRAVAFSVKANIFGQQLDRHTCAAKTNRRFDPADILLGIIADTAGGTGSHEKLLSRFAMHQADILVGTQMVAKGLDFPDVRLVGILLADVGANFHDYRVDEHSFQMLTQVAGRAGRAAEQGLAILQTFQPDRYSIRSAVTGDYDRFYQNDLAYRRMLGYPPFSRMVRLEIRDADPDAAQRRIGELAAMLKNRIRDPEAERKKPLACDPAGSGSGQPDPIAGASGSQDRGRSAVTFMIRGSCEKMRVKSYSRNYG